MNIKVIFVLIFRNNTRLEKSPCSSLENISQSEIILYLNSDFDKINQEMDEMRLFNIKHTRKK